MGMPVTSGLNFPSLVNVWISPSFLKMWNLGVDSSFLSTLEKLYDIPFLLVSVSSDKTTVIQLVSPIFLSLHTRFCLCFQWEEQGKEHLFHLPRSRSLLYHCILKFWWLYFNIMCFLCNPISFTYAFMNNILKINRHPSRSTDRTTFGESKILREIQRKQHKIIFQDNTMGPAPFCTAHCDSSNFHAFCPMPPRMHREGKL